MHYDFTFKGFGVGPTIVGIVIGLIYLAAWWRLFEKAGLPGWGALIPFYNIYLFVKVAQRPGWWVILCFIPIVHIIITIVLCFDIARVFGKSSGWGFGLLFLGFIFFPILAFGEAAYQGQSYVRT